MILYHDNGFYHFFGQHFIRSGVNFSTIYRNVPVFYLDRLTRGFLIPRPLKFNLPECGPDDDKVICFDTHTNPSYLSWICRKYRDKRVILWFWNPLGSSAQLDLMPRKAEIWSYSREDCRKYGLQFNTAFYFDDLAREAASSPSIQNDIPHVFFAGREKGRESFLSSFRQTVLDKGAAAEIHIMKNKGGLLDHSPGREKCMTYAEMINCIRKADILLDYSSDPDAGLSLRPMEALFWNKKLITNNRSIRNYDFYYPDNIYLLGEDSRDLGDFIHSPGRLVPDHIKNQYLLSSWLKRFDRQ